MDDRLRFVARLLDGEKMAPLCREFDLSRNTGYRVFQRYKDCGLEGPIPPSTPLPAGEAAVLPDQETDRSARAGATQLGRAEDPGEAKAAAYRDPDPGYQHRAGGARSPWPGQPRPPTTPQGAGHHPIEASSTQRSVVRRLQRRVHACLSLVCQPNVASSFMKFRLAFQVVRNSTRSCLKSAFCLCAVRNS